MRVVQPVLKGIAIIDKDVQTTEVGGYNLPQNVACTLDDAVGKYAACFYS